MAMWNPWRGCHKYSEGCRYCYIHKGDLRRGVDTGKSIGLIDDITDCAGLSKDVTVGNDAIDDDIAH